MILRIEKLQEACKNILTAVDNNELSAITETLELEIGRASCRERV